MNRLLMTAVAILFVSALAHGATVSENEARARASAFFGAQVPQKSLARKAPAMKGKSGAAAYYVFNSPTEQPGWVIIAGDDRARTVLAWGENYYYDENDIPAGMQALLNEYARQISGAGSGEEQLPADYVPSESVTGSSKSHVAPMLSTLWGQDKPYSYRTPYVDGEHCLTGSTATAIAQILNFHKSVAGCTALPAYTTSTLKISMPALPATTFDYSKMGDGYDTKADSLATLELAKLLLYCGQASTTDYNTSESKATLGRNTFVTYFGYDESAFDLDRRDVTQSEWEDLIHNELVYGRPVAMSAAMLSGSQSFVVDGYDDGLFHVNWGMGDSKNGYFALNALTYGYSGSAGPAQVTDAYSMNLKAVIGLQPATGNTAATGNNRLSCYGSIAVNLNSSTRASTDVNFNNLVIEGRYWNNGAQAFAYDMGWTLYDPDGNEVMTKTIASYRTVNPQRVATLSTSMVFGAGLPDGDYTFVPVCRVHGTEAWTPLHGSSVNYVKARISGTTLTIEVVSHLSAQNLSLERITVGTVKRRCFPVKISLKVKNNGTTDYSYIYLWCDDELVACTTTDLAPGEQGMVYMNFMTTSSGTKTLKFTADKEGTKVLGTTTCYLESALGGGQLTAVNTGTLTGTTLSVKSVITNIMYYNYVNYVIARLWRVKPDGTSELASEQKTGLMILAEGNTALRYNFNNLEPGESYYVTMHFYLPGSTMLGTMGDQTEVFTVESPYSKNDVNQDGSVNAADVTALYGTILGNTHRFDRYGDVNGDGSVNAADVTAVYNAILGN